MRSLRPSPSRSAAATEIPSSSKDAAPSKVRSGHDAAEDHVGRAVAVDVARAAGRRRDEADRGVAGDLEERAPVGARQDARRRRTARHRVELRAPRDEIGATVAIDVARRGQREAQMRVGLRAEDLVDQRAVAARADADRAVLRHPEAAVRIADGEVRQAVAVDITGAAEEGAPVPRLRLVRVQHHRRVVEELRGRRRGERARRDRDVEGP